jgi:hypothetical protein
LLLLASLRLSFQANRSLYQCLCHGKIDTSWILYILLALQCLIAVNCRTFQWCSNECSLYARGCLTKFIIGSQHLGREVDRLSYCHLSMVKIILANISTQVLWCWGTHFFSVVQYLSFELLGIIESLRKCTSVRLSLFFFPFLINKYFW